MSEQLKFFKGLETNLPTSGLVKGGIYHCTDTGNTYISHDGKILSRFSTTEKQVIKANRDNIVEMIEAAHEGATIELEAGNYDELRLYKGMFPSNLTIKGNKNTIMNGMFISSGVYDETMYKDTDLTRATLPSNLTITGITFEGTYDSYGRCLTGPVRVHNCIMENLTIKNCTFNSCWLRITPNRVVDEYGRNRDNNNDNTSYDTVPYYANRQIKNLVVKNCTFKNINDVNWTYPKDIQAVALFLGEINGATIQANHFEYPGRSAIQFDGRKTAPATGRIILSNNYIKMPAGRRMISGGTFENAKLTLQYNTFYGFTESPTAVVELSDMKNTTVDLNTGNIYQYHKNENLYTEQVNSSNKTIIRNSVYVSSASNLVSTLKKIAPNTTIYLAGGTFSQVNLHGIKSFPDNITIIGNEFTDTVIPGISISSGSSEVNVTANTMAKNLTFKNIHFSNIFSVRNCNIEGLKLQGCRFISGAHLSITPNRAKDIYGEDSTVTSYSSAIRQATNLTIQNCYFFNVSGTSIDPNIKAAAMFLENINGCTIYNNRITTASGNGIMFNATDDRNYSTGHLNISNNEISQTDNLGININKIKNATISIFSNNIYNGTPYSNNVTRIQISDFDQNTITQFSENYCYNTTATLIVNKGIALYPTITSIEENLSNINDELVNINDELVNITNDLNDLDNSFQSHLTANNPHQITAETLGINKDNLQYKKLEIRLSDTTKLMSTIANAQPNTTIILTNTTDMYPELRLVGKNSFPENLTIKGISTNVKMNGVFISSGVPDESTLDYNRDVDISNAIMSKNLTIDSIKFVATVNSNNESRTGPVRVQNCSLENFTVKNCVFDNQTWIRIVPNRFQDEYKSNLDSQDGTFTTASISGYMGRKVKNLTIKNCTFKEAKGVWLDPSKSTNVTAIYLQDVDGIFIQHNTIESAGYNGIQIASGLGNCSGKIFICRNTIKNTVSRSIRFSSISDAKIKILNNKLINTGSGDPECIKFSGYDRTNTTFELTENTYAATEGGSTTTITVESGLCVLDGPITEYYVKITGTSASVKPTEIAKQLDLGRMVYTIYNNEIFKCTYADSTIAEFVGANVEGISDSLTVTYKSLQINSSKKVTTNSDIVYDLLTSNAMSAFFKYDASSKTLNIIV